MPVIPLFTTIGANQERRNRLFSNAWFQGGRGNGKTSVARAIVFAAGRRPRPVIKQAGSNK